MKDWASVDNSCLSEGNGSQLSLLSGKFDWSIWLLQVLQVFFMLYSTCCLFLVHSSQSLDFQYFLYPHWCMTLVLLILSTDENIFKLQS